MQLISRHDELYAQYPRFQWSYVPHTSIATVMLRELVQWSTPGPGCWGEDAFSLDAESRLFTGEGRRRRAPDVEGNTTCVDVSYKALVDSYDHYVERALYTEMEMFVSVEFVLPLLADWLDAQASLPVSDSLYCNHRYVAADTLPLR